MRMSQLFSRTLRQAPSGAESKGYEYLLRAGYIKQLGAGIFSALPLGFRSLRKIEEIIREEMDAIGGQEMLMPVVNTAELWKETGRYFTIDKELSRFKDRTGRDMVLAMTHEEAVTALAAQEISSYKQLPCMVYHIQTKWRDDPRPRAGLIRVREFTMKDSYTFDEDYEGLAKQYAAHYESYFKIFGRCGLPVIAVGSDSGMMGGKVAHEYMYLSPIGEDTIILCGSCGYTANRQVAVCAKDPGDDEQPQDMREVSTPGKVTIEALAEFLDIPAKKTAKALFLMGTFTDDENQEYDQLIVALIRGDLEAEDAKIQKAARANRIRGASDEEIRSCGIEPGYGSPIGASGCLVIADDSVAGSPNLAAGANREGYHLLNTNFGRDYTGTVADIAGARDGSICASCGAPMSSSRGIEVGNIFQLGTRYSESLGCTFQDRQGKQKPVVMGSYGIGLGRLLACIAEEHHDEKGLILPITSAPYQVHLVSLLKDSDVPDLIYHELRRAGIEVLYDDRTESAGVKFTDAELMGIPIHITLGKKNLEKECVEISLRGLEGKELISLPNVVSCITAKMYQLKQEIMNSFDVQPLA